MNKKQKKVQKILDELSKLKIKTEKTSASADELGELIVSSNEGKKALKALHELKITRKWLFENGFIIAGMLLKL